MLIVFLICWKRKQSANSNQYQTMVLAGQNYQISPSPFPSRFGPKVSSLVAKKKVKSLFRYTLIWQGSRYDILTAVKKKIWYTDNDVMRRNGFSIKKKWRQETEQKNDNGRINQPTVRECKSVCIEKNAHLAQHWCSPFIVCVCGGDKVK